MSAPVITKVEDMPAVTSLRRKDLLGIADLSAQEISLVLDTDDFLSRGTFRIELGVGGPGNANCTDGVDGAQGYIRVNASAPVMEVQEHESNASTDYAQLLPFMPMVKLTARVV